LKKSVAYLAGLVLLARSTTISLLKRLIVAIIASTPYKNCYGVGAFSFDCNIVSGVFETT